MINSTQSNIPQSVLRAAECLAAERGFHVDQRALVTAIGESASVLGIELVDIGQIVSNIVQEHYQSTEYDDAVVTVKTPITLVIEVMSLLQNLPESTGLIDDVSAIWFQSVMSSWKDQPVVGLKTLGSMPRPLSLHEARKMLRENSELEWAADVANEPQIPIPAPAYNRAMILLGRIGMGAPTGSWEQWLDLAHILEGRVNLGEVR